jgi:hypothetical protein
VLPLPIVLAASGFMACVEFFADKLSWLDSAWDARRSTCRPSRSRTGPLTLSEDALVPLGLWLAITHPCQ